MPHLISTKHCIWKLFTIHFILLNEGTVSVRLKNECKYNRKKEKIKYQSNGKIKVGIEFTGFILNFCISLHLKSYIPPLTLDNRKEGKQSCATA